MAVGRLLVVSQVVRPSLLTLIARFANQLTLVQQRHTESRAAVGGGSDGAHGLAQVSESALPSRIILGVRSLLWHVSMLGYNPRIEYLL